MQENTLDGDHVNGGKKATGGDTEVDFNSSAFEALERDFQEVLSELVGDKSLERFRSGSTRETCSINQSLLVVRSP